MMKHVLLSLLLSSGFAALTASPAFAQSAPNTTQTDQSEEDWRKSKKKSSTDDPLDGFKNINGWGQGTQRTLSPVDMLPEDSRRFLMKERAQRLAEAGIGEPVDTSFEPSAEAKTDPDLEADEKAAWSEMMKDLGGAGGQPPADQSQMGKAGGDPNAQPGQAGGAPKIPTQVGEVGGNGSAATSVMRGGSSASVSDILAQLKGGGSAPRAQAPQGQMGSSQTGQNQSQGAQGQNPQGQAQAQNSQAQNGQAQASAPTAAQMQAQAAAAAQAQNAAQSQSNAQDAANTQAQASSQAQANAQAQNDAQSSAQAQAEAAQAAAAARIPEAISPLDRLKQTRDERASTGRRSSASDYLNRGN